jgi:predicted ATP-grasp superfamily ATP-dependent carboligase
MLGPSLDAIELCSDKLALFEHWQVRGVPTPETFPCNVTPPWPEWVLKPRFGAGSQDTQRNGTPREHGAFGPMIVQEFVPGRAASVAFLCGPKDVIALPPAEQLLSDDGHFHYRGGRLPMPTDLARRAEIIARQALTGIRGLCGYVGVDLVLGDDGRDWAIEINPRLTTSYLGLRKLAKSNLAAAMLQLAASEPAPALEWNAGPVEFQV